MCAHFLCYFVSMAENSARELFVSQNIDANNFKQVVNVRNKSSNLQKFLRRDESRDKCIMTDRLEKSKEWIRRKWKTKFCPRRNLRRQPESENNKQEEKHTNTLNSRVTMIQCFCKMLFLLYSFSSLESIVFVQQVIHS